MRIGPLTLWALVVAFVMMASWSLLTGSYFAFRDDVLTRLIARQVHMQIAYEDRIAELRAQVDRITSRQLLDQEQFEQKLDAILHRQATLEARSTSLTAVPNPMPTGSIKLPSRNMFSGEAESAPKLSPINDTMIFVAPPEREARLESRRLTGTNRIAAKTTAGGLEGILARLQDSLDRVETRQVTTLDSLEESYDAKAKRMRGLLADLGLSLSQVPTAGQPMGGPFIPITLNADAGAFERQIFRISLARMHVDTLTRTLLAVPLRKPIYGEMETTSGFGVRSDPFLRSPAMHTGLDIRGSHGDPVRATASGTVASTGWNGGYGRMVEIDHGNGLSTRYAHLSSVEVKEGQSVRAGQIVGRIGSTGRSTGPHLHYETRIDGDAVDPQKFLRAGLRMGNVLAQ
jgi:murein DD-endopeptidase MepM/ murein hydrolase activator NlpD